MRATNPPGARFEVLHIAPLQGHAGVYGPSCEALAQLALDEINSDTGILGRELCLTLVDGGVEPERLGAEVSALLSTGLVQAITGSPTAAGRMAVMRAAAGRVPCVFGIGHDGLAPSQSGTFMIGEHPGALTYTTMRWLNREYGLRNWAILTSDYRWALRMSARLRRRLTAPHRVVGEFVLPMGTREFTGVLTDPRLEAADGVLLFLIPGDAVRFNRAFTESGRAARQVRLGPSFDENILLAGGPGANANVFVASSTLADPATDRELRERYLRTRNDFAPAFGRFAYGSYLSVQALRAMVEAVGAPSIPDIHAALRERSVLTGPAGEFRFWDDQILRPVRIAHAEGVILTVLTA
ncbi:ABC transporter substrate-binding protein [Nocardia sp. NBC_01503]|uniref:ABC transporter substrate-binding protein n=1 Tax=Nocardia sp. NBC_01503 TaxID=2975997 RepID=UPI002E7B7DE5|nr:ABC transporter substrate-binding protein [Nocardia sp. NBC_01503]WTL34209.1 ABC transporter substrate-binding protein [Nocardia sp. NBC_01503]